jgi:transglutaminase-like putative cysteine protease
MPLFKIHHVTQYRYDRPIRESANQIKIYPSVSHSQDTRRHELSISGNPSINQFIDFWGNYTGLFMRNEMHQELIIDSKLTVHTNPPTDSAQETASEGDWETTRQRIRTDLRLLDCALPENIKSQDVLNQMVLPLRNESLSPFHFAGLCSEYIYTNFAYLKGITNIETTVDEILSHKSGVCQDFAHLLLQMLRSQGIPARYVSGYICPNRDGARGAGATHAWVEVWLPEIGWKGIDPTNNIWVGDQHVALAVGRHFGDCSPMKGTFKGPAYQELLVFVSVGYEDGHTLEDNTTVQLAKESLQVQKKLFEESMQQQQ